MCFSWRNMICCNFIFPFKILEKKFYGNMVLGVKKIAVFPLARPTLFQITDCYFLSVKMQNKKVKHCPSTKYLFFFFCCFFFHKIKDPTLFFSGEK